MRKEIILLSAVGFISSARAQWLTGPGIIYNNPITSSVGIGTSAPAYSLDVRGYSTFGSGLTQADYAWTPSGDQMGMILTGDNTGNTGFGTYVAGSASNSQPGQILGAYLFGQRVPIGSTPANIGIKAAIHCFANTTGNAPTGHGGIMSLATTEDNAAASQITVERVRVHANGNVGVGDYRLNPLWPIPEPARRLEVLSDKVTVNGNGTPQLRLTQLQQNQANPVLTGRFTDFHTTNQGDLGITTRDNTLSAPIKRARFVGIQTNLPGNTLEINSRLAAFNTGNGQPMAPTFAAPTGSAGVRFSDLKSTSIPQANPGPGVLSIDALGDIIYVPGIKGANNGLSVNNGIVQLGAPCPATGAQLVAAMLLGTRQIPTNGFNVMINGAGRVGIGKPNNFCAPGNKLEVDNSSPGALSGLRLTDLANSPNPIANPHTPPKVLTVNLAGDVILTNAPSGVLGGICGSGANPLLNNWEIPLNNRNFIFGGQGVSNYNVGVGTSCFPVAKLEVNESSGTSNTTGFLSTNTDVDGVGVRGVCTGGATNAQTKVGGWFEATPGAGALQVALYTPQTGGVINFGYPTPSAVGSGAALLNVNGSADFQGDVFPINDAVWMCGGPSNRWNTVYAFNGAINTSDGRQKENIKDLGYGIKDIMKLHPVSFNWKNKPDEPTKLGLIAQELQGVIKEVVKEGNDPNKTMGVFYSDLIPVLIKGIQEQQQQIDELKTLVQSLAGTNPSGNKMIGTSQSVDLSDKNAIVLNQNVPNPFAESTVIIYNIPSFTKAQIIFATSENKIIKTVDITEKGEGRLNVFANDLSSGMYMYTLIVDGKTIETKKMIKN